MKATVIEPSWDLLDEVFDVVNTDESFYFLKADCASKVVLRVPKAFVEIVEE